MHKLKKLQGIYMKGEITKQQYEAELAKLLEDDYIDQGEHDDAKNYNPDDDKPIYTQADVDSFIAKKATSVIRKALKDAGIEVEGTNKDLLPKVVELVKAGQSKDGTATDEDLQKLQTYEKQVPTLQAQLRELQISNAVMEAAGKYNPHNMKQLVRALKSDYADLLEVDDESGELDSVTVDKALKKVRDAEPNLFKEVEGGDEGNKGGQGGRGPRGGSAGSGTNDDLAAKKLKGLELMGYGKK